jgi:hypothetical protein
MEPALADETTDMAPAVQEGQVFRPGDRRQALMEAIQVIAFMAERGITVLMEGATPAGVSAVIDALREDRVLLDRARRASGLDLKELPVVRGDVSELAGDLHAGLDRLGNGSGIADLSGPIILVLDGAEHANLNGVAARRLESILHAQGGLPRGSVAIATDSRQTITGDTLPRCVRIPNPMA